MIKDNNESIKTENSLCKFKTPQNPILVQRC